MNLNINFEAKPILQLFVIAFRAISQPIKRKITKMVLRLSYVWSHILKTILQKSILSFANDR